MENAPKKTSWILVSIFVLLSSILIGFLVYIYITFTKENERLITALIASQNIAEEQAVVIADLGGQVAGLEQEKIHSERNTVDLMEMLDEELNKNRLFENQIRELAGTVGILDKLSKTDAELLRKYSKVYFLNEHYGPEGLAEINADYVSKTTTEYIHIQVAPFLNRLLRDARDDGIELYVTSAYRSYQEQAGLKNAYTVQYGVGANTFSADQGYSEHQLGTTVDFVTKENNLVLSGFQNTEAYTWLKRNAHRYGFTLSYPEKNEYYIYEPWHWRFVGRELARDLYDDGKFFYDLDQRTIDSYLISLFD